MDQRRELALSYLLSLQAREPVSNYFPVPSDTAPQILILKFSYLSEDEKAQQMPLDLDPIDLLLLLHVSQATS